MKGMILLTGGSGMVGRNILEHPGLVEWEVCAPSRTELDLRDYKAVETYLARTQPFCIIHAAGLVGGIQANISSPVDFLVANTDIGRNVVLAARASGVRHLINVASSCMYPRDAVSPLSEDLILKGELEPTNEGYALAKIFITRLCEYVKREAPQLNYKTLIPCNLYGRHDKFSPHNSHLLPAIIHKVHSAKLNNTETVEIWGDGKARREFMYAADCADAVIRALKDFDRLPDLMNIGMGYDHSVADYYQVVAKVLGWQGRFVHDLTKPVGMRRKLVNIDKQTAWGWAPCTSLESGIKRTYEYYLSEVEK